MQIEDYLVEEGISIIGPTAFSMLCYFKLKCKSKEERFLLKNIMFELNLSKPIVIEYLKQLRNIKFISTRIELAKGKKSLYIKVLQLGKGILPNCKKTLENQDSSCIRFQTTRKQSGKIPLPVSSSSKLLTYTNVIKTTVDNNKYKKAFKKLIEMALQHGRFNNSYYKNKHFKYGTREVNHLKYLLENVSSIEEYMEWWLKKKASKIPGLNIGIICCCPMVEEYKIDIGRNVLNREKGSKKNKVNNFKRMMVVNLLNKQAKGHVFTTEDIEFLQSMLEEGIIKKIGKNYEKIILEQ